MAKTFEIFECSFTIVCILVTFGLVSWCVYEYQLDLNLSLVSLKEIREDDNMIMPAMSLCFRDPFLTDKFENGDLGFNVSYLQYKKFLLGSSWDDRLYAIDFENVTKRIEDYLVRYDVIWRNGSNSSYLNTPSLPEMIKKPYPSFVGSRYGIITKCYGFNIPRNAKWFLFVMKRDIFPGGIRPNKDYGLAITFHYPNQFFRSVGNAKWDWPKHIQRQNQCLRMLLRVKTFEITQRRNTRKQKCNSNWKEYDIDVARHYLKTTGCRPVYGVWDSSYPICNSSEKMKMAFSPENLPPIMDPCQSADKIVFEHADQYVPASNWLPADSIKVGVDMQVSRIKVIEQKRAYDLQTLIGNSGGYIGLLLGTYCITILNQYSQCLKM